MRSCIAPSCLLLDEPTSGVDPHSQLMLWDLIQSFVHQGMTVLLSTHHMGEAQRCHQLVYLSDGKLLTEGSAEQIIKKAKLATWVYVGEQLSSVAQRMRQNFPDVQIIEHGNEVRLSIPEVHADAVFMKIQKTLPELSWLKIPTRLEDVFVYLLSNSRRVNHV